MCKFNLGDLAFDPTYGWAKITKREEDWDGTVTLITKNKAYPEDGCITNRIPCLLTIGEAYKRYPEFPYPKQKTLWFAYDIQTLQTTSLFFKEECLEKSIAGTKEKWITTYIEVLEDDVLARKPEL